MAKDYSNMDEKQLLAELIKESKKTSTWQTIAGVAVIAVCLVIAGGFFYILPKFNAAMNQLNSSLATMDTVVTTVQTSIENANVLIDQGQDSLNNIDIMVENVNGLVEDNTEQVTSAVENFNDVDFEALNSAIRSLAEVVQPLADFTSRFS